jgi:hypothetical protein
VIRRSGGQCEIPGCTRRTFLALAHDCAHAAGGSREEANLWHACRCHHLQFDAGLIRICGWKDGRPTFCDAEGRLLEDRARIVPPCPAAFGADDGSRDAEDAVATPPAECPAAVDPPDALETAAESQGDEAPADDRRHREQATRHAIAAAPEAYPGTRSNRDRPREPQRRVRSARPRPGADRTPAPRQAAAATQRGGRRAARWSGVRRAAGSSEPAPAGTPSQGGPLPRNRAVLRIQRRSRGEPSQDEHLHERPPPHPPD